MNDVEDFLRRVAQMRAEAQAKARQANQPRTQQPPAPPPQPQQQQPQRFTPPPRRLEPVATPKQPEVIEAQIADRAQVVDQRVREHLRGPEEMAEHARHLGEQVDQADDKLAAHLHEVFDHQLGQLQESRATVAAGREQVTPGGLSPEAISRLLRSPSTARDAIVLAEILQRPEQRW